MATYKVIQDIEAEDKLIGPLSFRQFIYALFAALFLYISFIVVVKHAAFLLVIFLPPAVFFGFFAYPFGKDQSTEIWALAKIRFLFKPRKRIWDQSGMKELVTITVPKRIEKILTDGLSEVDVRSRLSALANTIDSRGWAVKNVNVNLYGQANPLATMSSDRLIDINNIPQEVPNYDVQASDDIMDSLSNPIAQHFDQMIQASSQAHRQQLINNMHTADQPQAQTQQSTTTNDYWFVNQPAAQPSFAEQALVQKLKEQQSQPTLSYSHLRTLQPVDAQAQSINPAPQTPAQTSPPTPDPAILSLANNNDLNVATIARQANLATKHTSPPPDDEVVISLH